MNIAALEALTRRVILDPPVVEFSPMYGASPAFEYSSSGGVIVIRATDTSAAAAGLYAYLKDVCAHQYTWDAAEPLRWEGPTPDSPTVRRESPARHRYYLNTVTTGYSAPYWGWERWEQEIDWMALHGVNLPLVTVGHEAVLFEAFVEYGVPAQEVREWLGSAAHLPWTLMGCTNGLGGPLPRDWFDRRLSLARRIVDRMRSLGMQVVLPAFAGHVPDSLASGDIQRTHWQGFATALLRPGDESFAAVSRSVARIQAERLGTDHFYSSDPFIESIPPSSEEIAAHTAAIYRGISTADSEAVWVLQAWPFHYHRHFWTAERISAVTDAVPHGRLLLLDLWAEHAPVWSDGRGVAETPWLWCAVHNFGGRFSMHGDLDGLVNGVGEILDAARAGAPKGEFRGTGLAMEAIENNPVFYELATDLNWYTPALEDWILRYAQRRYHLVGPSEGSLRKEAAQAWHSLLTTLYRPGASRSTPSPVIARPWDADPPFAKQRSAGEFVDPDAPVLISANIDAENDPHVEGDLSRIAESIGSLLVVADGVDSAGVRTDVVDLLIHLISQRARRPIRGVARAHRDGDAHGVEREGAQLITLIDDLERLVATQPDRLLGTWLSEASEWGSNEAERKVLITDARRLLTVWGYQDSGLHDYSGRHWAGMLKDFYLPRWRMWIDTLAASAMAGAAPDIDGMRNSIIAHENRWINDPTPTSTETTGDWRAISRELLARYRDELA